MPVLLPRFRIFIAGPGDIYSERKIAEDVIDKTLRNDAFLNDVCSIEAISWTKGSGPAMLADVDPQSAVDEGIPAPSDCDIVVVIFWSRMGTPLPFPKYKKANGQAYQSGTEYEFETAIEAKREKGTPEVIVYRRNEPPRIPLNDPDIQEKTKQWQAVEDFFAQFHDEEKEVIIGGINFYKNLDEFKENLTGHLQQRLKKLIEGDVYPQQPPSPSEDDTPQSPSSSSFTERGAGPKQADYESFAEQIVVADSSDGVLAGLTTGADGVIQFYDWASLPGLYLDKWEFEIDESRRAFIDQLKMIQPWQSVRIVRLVGRPGVGKSRLVLESIREYGLEHVTLYAFSPRDVPPNYFNRVALTDTDEVTLVVDNCTYSDTVRLCQLAQPAKEKLRIVTIETALTFKPHALYPPVMFVEPLPDENVRKIVFAMYELYGMSAYNDDKAISLGASTWGDLKLAFAFVSVLCQQQDISSLAVLTEMEEIRNLLERYFPEDRLATRTLQGWALFGHVGLHSPNTKQVIDVAEFMGLGYQDFQQFTEELKRYGSLSNENWYWRGDRSQRDPFRVIPRFLSVHLAAQIWHARGEEIRDVFLLS